MSETKKMAGAAAICWLLVVVSRQQVTLGYSIVWAIYFTAITIALSLSTTEGTVKE